MSRRSNVAFLLLMPVTLVPACITDSVPTVVYDSSTPSPSGDTKADAGKPVSKTDAGASTKRDTGPATEPGDEPDDEADDEPDTKPDAKTDPAPSDDAGMSKPPADGGVVDNGPCDLTGHWLITQHGVQQALGVRQAGVYWYYYELEQTGGDLKVKKGLSCGGHVIPIDLLAGIVDFEDTWPGMLEKNTHAGRTGKVTSSGSNCSVSFEKAFTVMGATTPYYADPSNALPTLDQEGSGDTPGWEDWDDDGQPGISLHVSGLATGTRYTSLRLHNDWTKGKYSPGATSFKASAVADQDESVLGATDEIIKGTAVPDTDQSVQFAQFAKLEPDQVQGDDASVCATIRDLAPMLTREANQ